VELEWDRQKGFALTVSPLGLPLESTRGSGVIAGARKILDPLGFTDRAVSHLTRWANMTEPVRCVLNSFYKCNEIYDRMDEVFGKIDRALEDRILNPCPGITPAILALEEERDRLAASLDEEMKDLGYFVFVGLNTQKIAIQEMGGLK
jgi:hypothetical protein